MRKEQPPLVIYPSCVRTLVLVTISAALLALPVVALLLFWDRIEEIITVSYRLYAVTWMGIGLFLLLGALGLVFNVRQFVLPKPVVTISCHGIEPLWYGLIEWGEIDHVAKVQCKGQCLLGIFPKDSDEFLARQTTSRRALVGRAIEQGFPPVYVTQLALPIPIDEVLAEIQCYTDSPITRLAR